MLLMGHARMLASDFGGTITWTGVTIPATIGSFDVQQILSPDGGGFSPSVIGIATVSRADVLEKYPAFTGFKRGQSVTCTPADTNRPSRNCRIFEMRDCGPLIELSLNDLNQGA